MCLRLFAGNTNSRLKLKNDEIISIILNVKHIVYYIIHIKYILSKIPNRKTRQRNLPAEQRKKNIINNENTKYKRPLRVTVLGACFNAYNIINYMIDLIFVDGFFLFFFKKKKIYIYIFSHLT